MPEEVIITPSTPEPPTTGEQPENQEPTTPPIIGSDKPKNKASKFGFLKSKKFLIIFAVILVLGGGTVAALMLTKKDKSPTENTSEKKDKQTDKVSNVGNFVANGHTYFGKPKEIKDLILAKSDECKDGEDSCTNGRNDYTKSYAIGETDDNLNNIILYRVFAGIDSVNIIVVKNDNKYEIAYPTKIEDYFSADAFKSNVVTSSSTKLDELVIDPTITIKQQPLKSNGYLDFAFLDYDKNGKLVEITPDKGTKLFTKGNIDYYQTSEDKGPYKVKSVTAYFGDLIKYNVSLDGELNASDSKADEKIVWSKGDKTVSSYYTGGQGCGSGATYVVGEIDKTALTEVGKTPGGQTLYQITDQNHAIVKELFEKDYKAEYALDGWKGLTLQQFVDKHGYFLIENGLDEFMVMISNDAIPTGGCAKPVVYLYPTKTTSISVSVGADVTISEPQYPAGGWKNVVAQPNGQLNYLGNIYGSLFWEGQGNGRYPEIKTGTVVKNQDVISTIKSQLEKQGLQGREITEFIDFWRPNLPTDPYVRLTWLSKNALDELAPLNVNPKPDTVIRVFLDFEGLSKPVNLPSQRFVTPKRNGFTVVEWGGLARNGLNKLIR